MSRHEHPHHGGSYVRSSDGSLRRVERTEPQESIPATVDEAIEQRMEESRAAAKTVKEK